jgi:hypothetical protein
MKLYHKYKVNQEVFIFEDQGELYHCVETYDDDGFLENVRVWHKNNDITSGAKGQEVRDAVRALYAA